MKKTSQQEGPGYYCWEKRACLNKVNNIAEITFEAMIQLALLYKMYAQIYLKNFSLGFNPSPPWLRAWCSLTSKVVNKMTRCTNSNHLDLFGTDSQCAA